MKVYKDPLLSGNTLMGYKGQSVMDCGYFYAPYIPPHFHARRFEPRRLRTARRTVLEQGSEAFLSFHRRPLGSFYERRVLKTSPTQIPCQSGLGGSDIPSGCKFSKST